MQRPVTKTFTDFLRISPVFLAAPGSYPRPHIASGCGVSSISAGLWQCLSLSLNPATSRVLRRTGQERVGCPPVWPGRGRPLPLRRHGVWVSGKSRGEVSSLPHVGCTRGQHDFLVTLTWVTGARRRLPALYTVKALEPLSGRGFQSTIGKGKIIKVLQMTDKCKHLEQTIRWRSLCNTWQTRGCFLSTEERFSNQRAFPISLERPRAPVGETGQEAMPSANKHARGGGRGGTKKRHSTSLY